ncbi:MAG: hypothetical protein K2N23_07440, partial [Clostridia bacterium]|nr:hypothetical protein [Clostridia bacterium]
FSTLTPPPRSPLRLGGSDLCKRDSINSGVAETVRQQTWNKINATYKIPINNYYLLSFNDNATEDFLKLCSNEKTQKMDDEIGDILELFKYDKFDKYFEPYLRIYSEEKEN